MSFRTKIFTLSLAGILVTSTIIITVLVSQKARRQREIAQQLDQLSREECAKMAKDVYLMLRAYHEKLRREIHNDLTVAHRIFEQGGRLSVAKETVPWDIVDQFTRQRRHVIVPRVRLGTQWLDEQPTTAVASPVVDDVKSLVGSTCTIFQRINKAGDMLRVCTNVRQADGTRAIGTYIPAVTPDGKPDPVVAAVLRGHTFVGRAYVVNDWYLTAYEPIRDAGGQVVGMLYVGVPQEDIPDLRRGIMGIVPGKTGYVYILGGSGDQQGRYVISYQGRRDGENIWESKDADGNCFIQSLIRKALSTSGGACLFERYPWRNPDENAARWKTVAVTYFEPWDWVIAAGFYEDDYRDALAQVTHGFNQLLMWTVLSSIAAAIVCGAVSQVVGYRITAPLVRAMNMLKDVARGDYTKRLRITGNDDIGRMSMAINTAVEATAAAMQAMKDAAQREQEAQVQRAAQERKLAEAERQARSVRLVTGINRLHEALILPAPLADKLKSITQTAVSLLDLDFCRIWCLNTADLCDAGCIHAMRANEYGCRRLGKCLHPLASSGRYTHTDGDRRRIPPGRHKAGQIAAEEAEASMTNRTATDPAIADQEWAESLGLTSIASYKLHDADNEPTGVLAVFSTHPLSEENDAFLSYLAETTSNVIRDAGVQAELREKTKQALLSTRAKSEFLANMSHEIRTPMTSILGYADLLMDDSLSAADRKTFLATVRRNGEHLLHLINDILDLSKIEAGKLLLDVGPCNVAALFTDVVSLMRPRAEHRGIALSLHYEGSVPEFIVTDAARLRQAVINLVGNAVKFTERGGVRIAVSLLGQWRDGLPAVKTEIIDTGIGISEDVLPHLFQPFSQADGSTSRRFGGTGLGLAITRDFAERLGGELTVRSALGQGSTFTITVPAGNLDNVRMLREPTESIADTTQPQTAAAKELAGLRILLAEDGPDNQALLCAVLRKAGAEVETAENGRIAVDKAESQSFDLVLMDIQMPEMDGYQATRMLRGRGFGKPILALTAHAMTSDTARCLAAGCDDHLAKPIDRSRLIHTIAKFAGKPAAVNESKKIL
jgi:signal transduction histidine kinase/CheY-like chemotaxis protein